ncbi:MAG: Sua5 family C-terminal domain-containing protein, partial [Chloroflexota bacterium]
AHVMDDLAGKIDLVFDGGSTRVGVESTVLDLTVAPPAILRPGGVSRETLEESLGKVTAPAAEPEERGLKSPGRMKKHYAPRARLFLFVGDRREKVTAAMKERIGQLKAQSRIGVMVPEEEVASFAGTGAVVASLGSFDALEEVARRLFEVMRSMDGQGVDYIFALAPPQKGIGLAVFDRLYKAAGSQLVQVD